LHSLLLFITATIKQP